MENQSFLQEARTHLRTLSPEDVLGWASDMFHGKITFASSLGAEDQVITHLLAVHGLAISLFMLDTGRLFEETYRLLDETQRQYDLEIKLYFPDRGDVEEAVNRAGPNFFMRSVAARKECCAIRKVKPLRRALHGNQAWVTGLRREQSQTRQVVEVLEWDEAFGLYKINPLWNWSEDRVWDFIHAYKIPYNTLHDRGFPSIGCASCTRAIRPGENARAGRWWWESPETKECGIHIANGRVVRSIRQDEPDELPIMDQSLMRGGNMNATSRKHPPTYQPSYYPVFMNLKDKPCLVVGGGSIADQENQTAARVGRPDHGRRAKN